MNTESQLLQPTGQATPETRNEQVAPGLNFTQSGNQLQTTNPSLFLGVSNTQISVPVQSDSTSTVSTSQPYQAKESNYSLVIGIGVIFLIVAIVVTVIKLKSLAKTN